jgi:hypothetical protein
MVWDVQAKVPEPRALLEAGRLPGALRLSTALSVQTAVSKVEAPVKPAPLRVKVLDTAVELKASRHETFQPVELVEEPLQRVVVQTAVAWAGESRPRILLPDAPVIPLDLGPTVEPMIRFESGPRIEERPPASVVLRETMLLELLAATMMIGGALVGSGAGLVAVLMMGWSMLGG